ncbi:sulfotransferase family cytosolic 1B member 1 [Ixodes scapularis]
MTLQEDSFATKQSHNKTPASPTIASSPSQDGWEEGGWESFEEEPAAPSESHQERTDCKPASSYNWGSGGSQDDATSDFFSSAAQGNPSKQSRAKPKTTSKQSPQSPQGREGNSWETGDDWDSWGSGQERLPEPRIIKHHLPFSRSPYHPKAKYVVIVRNPFDCVVSFYHHCLGDRLNMDMRADTTFDEFFEDFMDGHVPFGEYFEHILSWYAHRNDPNVFFFYYEELREHQTQGILKIAEFIDESLADRLRKDEGLLKDVVQRTTFENMKANVTIDGDVHKTEQGEETDDPSAFIPLKNFFRKGRVGDWRSYFNKDQEQRLRSVYERRMQGTEMWGVWKEYLGYDDDVTPL